MILLGKQLVFPDVETADPHGILAIGGDLSPERLELAYRSGIFPWYNDGEPIIWYSPNLRMVLFPGEFKLSKSLKQSLRNKGFLVTFNRDFKSVIRHCKTVPRNGQAGTWITDDMEQAYIRLHERGLAKSVEVWQNQKLVGGLYGIDLGHVFCGESMFSLVRDASKVAFYHLHEKIVAENYRLIDCQVYNEHLARLGAREIPRREFIRLL